MTQIELDESARADVPERDARRNDRTHEVIQDVAYQRLGMVNVVYFGEHRAASGQWVLIDAGLPGTARTIQRAVTARFGEKSRPAAILLTHAHADHAGALQTLAEDWQVPVYAHPMEAPYLNGSAAYPPPDPSVGGGAMPALSCLFPRGPFEVGKWLQPLPENHSVPGMPSWKWILTPGHTPGHVSFWREADRTLIVGDAFVTTNQESVYAVALQKPELHGPPMYYTQNWEDAEASVKMLAALNPERVVTGHGRAMQGNQMRAALHVLASGFRNIAMPSAGAKYVEHPTRAATGTAYVQKKSE
jgi:glyoxylase-like metal-dependent hydrolase (beta-lactamase superfamily II)